MKSDEIVLSTEIEFVQIDNKKMTNTDEVVEFLTKMHKKHGVHKIAENFNYFIGAFCNEHGFYMGLNPKTSNPIIFNDLQLLLQYKG